MVNKNTKLISFIVIFSLSVCYAQGTDVSGSVSGSWTTLGEPYNVTDTIRVDVANTLTIDPGVRVYFQGDYTFEISGTLNADGTVVDSILFTIGGSATEFGGIRFLSGSAGSLTYARIEGGAANGTTPYNRGGAIYCTDATPTFSHLVIKNNSADNIGGGICLYNSNSDITDCIIENNSALYAGGIYLRGNGSLLNTKVYDNSSTDIGGAINLVGLNSPTIANNIIYNNTNTSVISGGAAIAALGGNTGLIINNVIYNNGTTYNGGGIYVDDSGTNVSSVNNILWGNTASNSGSQVYANNGTITIDYCDVQDSSIGIAGPGTLTYGSNNISLNPLFIDSSNNNFHILQNSPIVDTGTNTNAPLVDFDGRSRPFDGDRDEQALFDIGPYEYTNTAPNIVSDSIVTVDEDSTYTYQVVAVDTDLNEILSYTLLMAPAFLSINDTLIGEITGTPNNDDVGDHSVSVQVKDLNGATDVQSFTLSVEQVNDAPVVGDIPGETIKEDSSFTDLTLDNYVSDVDNNITTLDWSVSGTSNLNVTIDGGRIAHISAVDKEWNGTEIITFIAQDAGGLTDSDTALFTVLAQNDTPMVGNIPGESIIEGGSFTDIPLDNYVSDVDNDITTLGWGFSGSSNLNITIDISRVAHISAIDSEWNGTEIITFTAQDSGGLTDSDTVGFTINAQNDFPIVGDIPDQEITKGETFASITLDDFVTDADNADSMITWTTSPTNDITVTITNRVAEITVNDPEWHGQEKVTFTASDPTDSSDSDEATFTVNGLAPIISVIPSWMFNEDDSLKLTIDSLYQYVEDPDNPDSLLIYSFKPGKNVLFYTDSEKVVFKGPANWFGIDTVELKVSDGELADSAKIVVNVKSVNDVPFFVNLPDTITFLNNSDTSLTMSLYAGDNDLPIDSLRWQINATNNSLDLEFDNVTTVLNISAPGFIGTITVYCTLSDDSSASVVDSFYVKVKSIPTSTDELNEIVPHEYALYQNYPNPFNPITQIKFAIPVSGNVLIEVFNIRGQKVETILNSFKPVGYHKVYFNGNGISSGIYFYKIHSKDFIQVNKMILLK